MIDVLFGVFLALNSLICCSFGATVFYTAYTERWSCLKCLHKRRPNRQVYVGVPEMPARMVIETIEIGVRDP